MASALQVAFDSATYIEASTLTHTFKHVHTMIITVVAKIITNNSPNLIQLSFNGSTLHDCIAPHSTHDITIGYGNTGNYFFPKGTKVFMRIPTGLSIETGQVCIAGYGIPS